MNILFIDIPDITFINAVKNSSYLSKLYLASDRSVENIPNITFSSLDELLRKAKALKIDIALTFNKNLIQQGIAETFKKSGINIISVNKKWLNLETSRVAAKKLLNHYGINTPEVTKAPVRFPVLIKTDEPHNNEYADSITSLVELLSKFEGDNFYIEEFLNGETFTFTHIWDGENLLTIPPRENLSEMQNEKLNLYTTKMNYMLSDENADFAGFFASKLIWAKNDWYVLSFQMCIDKYLPPASFNKDFLFIINQMLYGKLNEL